jgi:hypothetical protein
VFTTMESRNPNRRGVIGFNYVKGRLDHASQSLVDLVPGSCTALIFNKTQGIPSTPTITNASRTLAQILAGDGNEDDPKETFHGFSVMLGGSNQSDGKKTFETLISISGSQSN